MILNVFALLIFNFYFCKIIFFANFFKFKQLFLFINFFNKFTSVTRLNRLFFKKLTKITRRKKRLIRRSKIRSRPFAFFLQNFRKLSRRFTKSFIYFFHLKFNFFLFKVRSNSSFLFNNKIPAFSKAFLSLNFINAFGVNARIPPKLTLLDGLRFSKTRIRRLIRTKNFKLRGLKRVDRTASINTYQFLDNIKFKFNRSKNFYFWRSLYIRYGKFLLNHRKIKTKIRAKTKTKIRAKTILISLRLKFKQKFIKKFKKKSTFFYRLYRSVLKNQTPALRLSLNFTPKQHRTAFALNFFTKRPFTVKKQNPDRKVIKNFFCRKLKNFNNLFFKITKFTRPFASAKIFYKSKLNALLFYASRWNAFFLSPVTGFLLVSNFQTLEFTDHQNLANFKKEVYSFGIRHSVERKILRKYFFYNNIEYYGDTVNRRILSLIKVFPSNTSFFELSAVFNFFISSTIKFNNWRSFEPKKHFWTSFSLEETDITIKRVRFKPGYSVIWREARSVLKHNLNLRFKYQHRLTSYLSKFKKIVKTKLLTISELTLLQLVTRAKFFPDYAYSETSLKFGLVYVNATMCFNPNIQIFIGDFFQVIVSSKYFIVHKILIGNVLKKKQKLDQIFIKTKNTARSKNVNYRSKWLLQNKNLLDDVPKFLEVDYYSLSCILLYEPFLWSDFNPLEFSPMHFLIINMYNWKYIN